MEIIAFAVGTVLLLGLGVAAGVVLAGERDRRTRLRLDAWRRDLWSWEQELLTAAAVRGCPSCELLRRRAELQRPLIG